MAASCSNAPPSKKADEIDLGEVFLDNPDANADTLNMIRDMGFPRDQAEHCLVAAFGNPDRTVDYLMNGIPAAVSQRHHLRIQQSQGSGLTELGSSGPDFVSGAIVDGSLFSAAHSDAVHWNAD